MSKFTRTSASVDGAPPIEFHFDGDVCTADYAGAKLRAEVHDENRSDLTVIPSDGKIIADILVRRLPNDENITVSVISVGSALLWSHYRWLQAQPLSGFVAWPNGQPPEYNGSGEPCDMWVGPCCCGATHLVTEREGQL